MMHRNLTTSEWTLMALESLMERGQLADWREFARALEGNEQLARDALRVSEYVEDRASASLVRVLVLQRFPGLAPGAGERRCEQNPGHLPSLSQILDPIHDEFRRSGMSEKELETLLEGELAEVRKERGAAKDQAQ
jgi:hypothetical protein